MMDLLFVWYHDRYGSKLFFSTISTHDRDLRSRSQTENLNVKVFVKGFKTLLFPNLITDLIHLWYDNAYLS